MSLYTYFPLRKSEPTGRYVSGVISAQVKDHDNETLLYEPAKAEFRSWSDQQWRDSRHLSRGNLRLQHSSKPVGKLTNIYFNDQAKTISVDAEIADPETQRLVREGVLVGFSLGGAYKKRDIPLPDGSKGYVPRIAEVSLVDKPSCPTCVFTAVKSAKFQPLPKEFCRVLAGVLVKAAKRRLVQYAISEAYRKHERSKEF